MELESLDIEPDPMLEAAGHLGLDFVDLCAAYLDIDTQFKMEDLDEDQFMVSDRYHCGNNGSPNNSKTGCKQ